MFKRRKPHTFIRNIREYLWPSMGWGRTVLYIKHRVIRLPESASATAAGLAIGAAVSFSPLVGTHLIQAAILAYIFRLNIAAALIGTIIGNPTTFPLMWWAGITLGAGITGIFGIEASTAIPEHFNFETLATAIKNDTFRVFIPWLIGSYIMAILSWPIFYGVFYQLIKTGRFAREKAMAARKELRTKKELRQKQKEDKPQ